MVLGGGGVVDVVNVSLWTWYSSPQRASENGEIITAHCIALRCQEKFNGAGENNAER